MKINKTIGKLLHSVNNSKLFAGIVMIMLNIGSKYITIELSKSQEEYLRNSIARRLLIFSIVWMGTRDIVMSLLLTAAFIIILPASLKHYVKDIEKNEKYVSKKDVADAKKTIERAKKQERMKAGFRLAEYMS
jgi:predicted membrane protein